MKKGLSILLIVAALFGFYGGAVNLVDVLACKDYWEEEGEKTTADLNKLEDGLDELGANTEAYLDGVDQVAQGESDLADGEKEYAEGLQKYKDGLAALQDAEDLYGGKGVPTLKAAYDNVNALMATKGSLAKTAALVAANSGGQVTAAQASTIYSNVKELMDGYSVDKACETAAAQSGADANQIKTIYQGVKTAIKAGYTKDQAIDAVAYQAGLQAGVKDAYDNVKMLLACNNNLANSVAVAAANSGADASVIQQAYQGVANLMSASMTEDEAVAVIAANSVAATATAKTGTTINGETVTLIVNAVDQYANEYQCSIEEACGVIDANQSLQSGTSLLIYKGYAEAKTSVKAAYEGVYGLMNIDLDGACAKVAEAAKAKDPTTTTTAETVKGIYRSIIALQAAPYNLDETAAIKQVAISAAEDSVTAAYEGVDKLVSGYSEDEACATVASVAGSTKDAIKTVFENVAKFVKGLTKDEACATVASAAGMTTAKIKEAYIGYQTYVDGKKQVAAAPAQLAAGEKQLAEGRQALADGKAQLAEYEDGEAQIRDGLATLMASEAHGGLTSIADRIGADEDFNLEDGNLDFDAAYNGVDEGRNYSADSSVVITEEVLKRGIGTAAGLGGALLAIIAAILCFAKKYKGAGVFAALTAVCGAAGIAVAKSAGTEFSELAGSNLSAVPYIAFGVLAGVAVLSAIADFTAKKEA